MKELKTNEIEQVSGGIFPFIGAVIALDAALIGGMIGSGLWKMP